MLWLRLVAYMHYSVKTILVQVTTACIATECESFNRIREVAPMITWAHASLPPNGILIISAIFAGLKPCDQHTDHAVCLRLGIAHIEQCLHCWQCRLKVLFD